MKDAGADDGFVLDPSITRGLDYYTGVVYETFLNKLPGIGSVCSGGRYDNLTSLYSKEQIPGVGSSIGLDRLQAAMEELGQINEHCGFADAAIVCPEPENSGKAQAAAAAFRKQELNCEVFLESKKISQQCILAEKKGIPWMIIPDYANGTFTLRNIASRENREIPYDLEETLMYEDVGDLARYALRQSKKGFIKEEDWKTFIRQMEEKRKQEPD
jgi:histidyl-tRNA synthetase